MSGFFGGLTNGNIRQPESQFNVGPLPSIANGPPGINADADGRYNFNSNLLEGITPYAYGQGRMGSDRSYQQVPHRIQQIIPMLHLPHADSKIQDLVALSHSVDQGDIAFVLGTHRVQGVLFDRALQLDSNIARSQLPARNAFINLPTCNYLLAGLQRLPKTQSIAFISQNRPMDAWSRLAQDLDFDPADGDVCNELMKLFRTAFVPYGICAGSENQGGQHETGLAPVQAAVNHVTTMTVDGQNRDLVNFWRRYDLNGGDQLILRFEYLPTRTYTLNHYYKGMVHQVFPTQEMCWQIVPDVYRVNYNRNLFDGIPRHECDDMDYDYRLHGYWRIGQMFHHRAKNDSSVDRYSDDTVFLQGALLQVTFAPVWVQYDRPMKKIAKAIVSSSSRHAVASKQHAGAKRKHTFGLGVPAAPPSVPILPSSAAAPPSVPFTFSGAASGVVQGGIPSLHFGAASAAVQGGIPSLNFGAASAAVQQDTMPPRQNPAGTSGHVPNVVPPPATVAEAGVPLAGAPEVEKDSAGIMDVDTITKPAAKVAKRVKVRTVDSKEK